MGDAGIRTVYWWVPETLDPNQDLDDYIRERDWEARRMFGAVPGYVLRRRVVGGNPYLDPTGSWGFVWEAVPLS